MDKQSLQDNPGSRKPRIIRIIRVQKKPVDPSPDPLQIKNENVSKITVKNIKPSILQNIHASVPLQLPSFSSTTQSSFSTSPGSSLSTITLMSHKNLVANASRIPSKLPHIPSKPFHIPSKPSRIPSKPSHIPGKPSHIPGKPSYITSYQSSIPRKQFPIPPSSLKTLANSNPAINQKVTPLNLKVATISQKVKTTNQNVSTIYQKAVTPNQKVSSQAPPDNVPVLPTPAPENPNPSDLNMSTFVDTEVSGPSLIKSKESTKAAVKMKIKPFKKKLKALSEQQAHNNIKFKENISVVDCVGDVVKYVCKLCKTEIEFFRKAKSHASKCETRKKQKKIPIKKRYHCTSEECDLIFTKKKFLVKHFQQIHQLALYSCSVCEKKIKKRSNYMRHIQLHREKTIITCIKCTQTFSNKGNLMRHIKKDHSHFTIAKEILLDLILNLKENVGNEAEISGEIDLKHISPEPEDGLEERGRVLIPETGPRGEQFIVKIVGKVLATSPT